LPESFRVGCSFGGFESALPQIHAKFVISPWQSSGYYVRLSPDWQ